MRHTQLHSTQLKGGPSKASDVFSLGVVLEKMRAVLITDVNNAFTISAIQRCSSKDPKKRPTTEELLEAIEQGEDHQKKIATQREYLASVITQLLVYEGSRD